MNAIEFFAVLHEKADIVSVNCTMWCFLCCYLKIQEFSDPRDADDARHYLDGRDVDGRHITVEFAKGVSQFLSFFDEL